MLAGEPSPQADTVVSCRRAGADHPDQPGGSAGRG
jgi:hypothetical protein